MSAWRGDFDVHDWEPLTFQLADGGLQELPEGRRWLPVNSSDRPQERADAATDEPDVAKVIPFPPGGRHGRNPSQADWAFTTDVRWVDGAEGEWLRKELASVVRELLVWASAEMNNSDDEHHGETRRAA